MNKVFYIFFMVEIVVATAKKNCESKQAQFMNVSFLSNCSMENLVSSQNNSDTLQCLCHLNETFVVLNRTCVKNEFLGNRNDEKKCLQSLDCNGTRKTMLVLYTETMCQEEKDKDSSTSTSHPTEKNSNKTQNRHSVIVMAAFVGACGLIILFCFIVFGLKPNARKETSDNRRNTRNNRNTESSNIKQDCCYEEPDKTEIQSSSHKVRLHSQAASGIEDTAGYLRPVWNPKVACSQHYSSVEIKDVKEDSNYPTGQPEHTVKRANHTKLMDRLHSKSRKIVPPKGFEINVYDEAEQVLQEKESTVADENLQASETMAKPPEELYHYPGEIIFVKKD